MPRTIPFNYLRYGRPGDPVRGSQYFRAYCYVCGEPMRVASQIAAQRGCCECSDCRGLLPAKVLTQQRALRTDFRPAIRTEPLPLSRRF